MELAAPLMAQYWTPGVARHIKVSERLRLECVALGRFDLLRDMLTFIKAETKPEVVRRGLARTPYLAYPHYGEKGTGFRDASYEVAVRDWVGRPGLERIEPPGVVRRRKSLTRRVMRRLRTQVRGLSVPVSSAVAPGRPGPG